jgi:nucleoside-diphosphate-sugar epimerase
MDVLVTGVSGFAASHIANALADAGHQVTGLHRRKIEHALFANHSNVNFVETKLSEIGKLNKRFDAVIHAAASMPSKGVSTSEMVADNVEGTLCLIDAAKKWKSKSFIFFSSVSLFGEISDPILDESSPIVRPGVYGATKLLGERVLAESKSLPALALRLPGVLGAGAHSNWLSKVAASVIAGRPIEAFDLNAPFNNAVHVDDIAKLLIATLARSWTGFDAVILGARGTITVGQAIERLAVRLGKVAKITECAPKKPNFLLSSDRAIQHWEYDPMDIGVMLDRYGAEARLTKLR